MKKQAQTRPRAVADAISTTSAAILGLVSVKPGSAYELAQRMKTNHHFIWPRAESKLYEEVQRLAALSLLSARSEATGRRPRTVYRITAAGRRALGAWASRPSEEPSLSFEALVKLAYADFATVDDARAQVAAVRATALRWVELGQSLAKTYLDEEVELQAPRRARRLALPERGHMNAIVWRFLAGYSAAMLVWTRAADAALAKWDGVTPSKRNAAATRAVFHDGLRLLAEAAQG